MKQKKDRDEGEQNKDVLPEYAEVLAAFHRTFYSELKAAVQSTPLNPAHHVLDLACGDGFYTGLFSQRLNEQGRVVGIDANRAFLKHARAAQKERKAKCEVEFIESDLEKIHKLRETFDVVWCAQSLFSLPEPVSTIKAVSKRLKKNGLFVILENDTFHQLLLPWPSTLEIALRQAELRAMSETSSHVQKYFIGRRLPEVFAEAGLEPLGFRTQVIDRHAPLTPDLEFFLDQHLKALAENTAPFLDQKWKAQLREFQTTYKRKPLFTMSWINVLAWARL